MANIVVEKVVKKLKLVKVVVTSRYWQYCYTGTAIQVLPPDIGEYFSSFFINAVFISILQLKNVFFISENSCQK